MLVLASIIMCVLSFGVNGASTRGKEEEKCCPFGVNTCASKVDVSRLFPGLFVNTPLAEIDNNFGTLNSSMKLGRARTLLTRDEEQRELDTNSTTSTSSSRRKRQTGSCTCCDTLFEYIAPIYINFNGMVLTVVHYEDSYQIIRSGVCVSGACGTSSTCTEDYELRWILVEDDNCPWSPGMMFVPVSVPSHCFCLT